MDRDCQSKWLAQKQTTLSKSLLQAFIHASASVLNEKKKSARLQLPSVLWQTCITYVTFNFWIAGSIGGEPSTMKFSGLVTTGIVGATDLSQRSPQTMFMRVW